MKWRNQLLALFCLLVFFAGGIFYFQHWVIQKPFGIILFVGEGLDATSLASARVAAGAGRPLTIDSLPFAALLRNSSENSATPDAAAAATALATGVKVNNGSISVDRDGRHLPTLLQLAREEGRMVGVITNGSLTAPTMASFYGHSPTSEKREELALQLAEKAHVDVALGGGAADFYPTDGGGTRSDGRELVTELRDADYMVVRTLQDLEGIPRWRRAKLFGLFSQAELTLRRDGETLDDQPTLADMVRHAIELLQFNSGGYLLIVDAALMRKARDENQSESAVQELLELDRAIGVALEYAGNKSAIFVCGDFAEASRRERPPAPAAAAPQEEEIGPVVEETPDQAPGAEPTPDATAVAPDVAVAAASPEPTPTPLSAASSEAPAGPPEDVIALATGLGADGLHGVLDNTAVFQIIRDNL